MASTEQLLEQWEQNYKKGLLTFWIFLAMAEEAQYAYGLRETIEQLSLGSVSADENSIYRALRRFASEGLIKSETRSSDLGPNRRYFELTAKGKDLLKRFVQGNILVFEKGSVKTAIKNILI